MNLLEQCYRSGQMSAEQYVSHVNSGEMPCASIEEYTDMLKRHNWHRCNESSAFCAMQNTLEREMLRKMRACLDADWSIWRQYAPAKEV